MLEKAEHHRRVSKGGGTCCEPCLANQPTWVWRMSWEEGKAAAQVLGRQGMNQTDSRRRDGKNG